MIQEWANIKSVGVGNDGLTRYLRQQTQRGSDRSLVLCLITWCYFGSRVLNVEVTTDFQMRGAINTGQMLFEQKNSSRNSKTVTLWEIYGKILNAVYKLYRVVRTMCETTWKRATRYICKAMFSSQTALKYLCGWTISFTDEGRWNLVRITFFFSMMKNLFPTEIHDGVCIFQCRIKKNLHERWINTYNWKLWKT